jgi:hypothetical protein
MIYRVTKVAPKVVAHKAGAEAVIVEGSTFCHGMTGQGFQLVSQQPDGTWKRLAGILACSRRIRLAGLVGQLELHGLPGVVLRHDGAVRDGPLLVPAESESRQPFRPRRRCAPRCRR